MLLAPIPVFSWTWTPFQASVWEPFQLFPEHFDVYGLRCNFVYGSNQTVTGLDAGLINGTIGRQAGAQAGLMNMSDDFLGIGAGLVNYANRLYGIQAGLVNTAKTHRLVFR